MHPLIITNQNLADLRPDPLNPREHPPAQIRRLVKAIRDFGFTTPIIVDEDNVLIAGHARLQAARGVPLETVPTIRISGLTRVQRRALALADNRLFEDGKWNSQKLAIVFDEILKIDATFDLESTGFSVPEIDLIVGADGSAEAVDRLPMFDTGNSPVTRLGDLWTLGNHRLLAGDARDPAAFQVLMNQQRARTVIADSPYNIEIPGFVSNLNHKNFQMGCGEMTRPVFTSFLTAIMGNTVAHSVDAAIGFWFIDWRHLLELLTAGYATHTELLNLCVWAKNPGQGSFYRSSHELIAVWKSGKGRHVNNVAGGKWSRSTNARDAQDAGSTDAR